MASLIVVRHGQASLMKADYDELSERGRAQATRLGEYVRVHDLRFEAAYCGPARRHRDTAALCDAAAKAGQGGSPWPTLVELPALDEHDAFGLLKAAASHLGAEPEIAELQQALRVATSPARRSQAFQRLFEVIMARWLRGEFEPEGVETWPHFRARVESALAEITGAAGSGGQTIAFSSVGPLAVMLKRALGTDDAASFRTAWRIRNASLTTFVFDRHGRLTLDGFNSLPHLPDPRSWTFR